ncbi:ATP-dependent DNA helicase PIF1-like [Chenopodium quinoa]|uniref:ATP-dependent DNA helicase PIF1-like n=1 Tax=Chenopodium quinoa TaxID=63459 RepID=UPI000B787D86|nr:ATP-dependent DNA helicase PIF1-like [Chenopodium quinoa]
MPLPIHLPNIQSIAVRPRENLRRVVIDPKRSRTPLTEYFTMIATIDGGTNLLYGEFPEHYRWDANTKESVERKNKVTVIGRIAFVLPAEEDDDAASICLAEAVEVQLPDALRRLFATVLIFCQPSDPSALWEKYYTALSEDFRYKFKDCIEKIKQLTVSLLEQHLESMGKSLKTFGLDHLSYNVGDDYRKTRDIADVLNTAIPQEFINKKERLNAAQFKAFDCIMKHIHEKKGGAFFIDGPGGTGKTFLYNCLYAEIRMMNKIVLPTATSGIVASNLPSRRTAHSRFKIPIDHENSLTCDVPKQGSLAQLIKEITLIIWDEASMANKANLQSLDLLLQDICDSTTLFGGKLVILGGDFRQVLPVVPQKSLKQAVE